MNFDDEKWHAFWHAYIPGTRACTKMHACIKACHFSTSNPITLSFVTFWIINQFQLFLKFWKVEILLFLKPSKPVTFEVTGSLSLSSIRKFPWFFTERYHMTGRAHHGFCHRKSIIIENYDFSIKRYLYNPNELMSSNFQDKTPNIKVRRLGRLKK